MVAEPHVEEEQVEVRAAEEPQSAIEEEAGPWGNPADEVYQAPELPTGAVREFDESSIPVDWSEVEDPTTGQVYFYNSVTGETSWERPSPSGPDLLHEEPEHVEDKPVETEVELPVAEEPESVVENDGTFAQSADEVQQAPASEIETFTESDESPLPMDWSEVEDPTSGQVYYCNFLTGETSWDRPVLAEPSSVLGFLPEHKSAVEASAEAKEEAPRKAEPESLLEAPFVDVAQSEGNCHGNMPFESDFIDNALQANWVEVSREGQVYYLNESTGETSWDRPVLMEPPSSLKHRLVEQEQQMQQIVDDVFASLNAEFGIDPAGDDLSDGQNAVVQGEPKLSQAHDSHSPVDLTHLPSGWAEGIDESTGTIYYYNAESGETSWEKPIISETPITFETSLAARPEDNVARLDNTMGVLGTGTYQSADGRDGAYVSQGGTPPSSSSQSASSFLSEKNDTLLEGEEGEKDVPEARIADSEYEWPSSSEDDSPESTPLTDEKTSHASGMLHETQAIESKWIQLRDGNGHAYYYNIGTHESSWDPPSAASESEVSNALEYDGDFGVDESLEKVDALEPELAAPTQALPGDWTAVEDPISGAVYYYNNTTGETSWEPMTAVDTDSSKSLIGKEETGINGNASAPEPRLTRQAVHVSPSPDTVYRADVLDVSETLLKNNDAVLTQDDSEVSSRYESRLPPSKLNYNSDTGETSWKMPDKNVAIGTSPEQHDDIDENRGETPSAEPALHMEADDSDDICISSDEVLPDVGAAEASLAPESHHSFRNDEAPPLFLLPEFWTSAVDEVSGRTYFFNSLTQETSWDPPGGERNKPEISADENNKIENSDAHGENSNSPNLEVDPGEPGSTCEPPSYWTAPTEGGNTDYSNDAQGDDSESPSEEPLNAEEPETFVEDKKGQLRLPDGWTIEDDPSTGRSYFFNTISGTTSWEPPLVVPVHHDQEGEPAVEMNHVRDAGKESLPAGWSECTDPQSGDTYFVNDSTGETRWDFPLLADIPEESNTQEYTVLESNGPDQIEGANLPDGWVMVEDPQSGEMYYFNDATGETSWELPTEAQSEEPNEAEYEKQTALLDETKHETTCAADHNEPLSELPSGWEAVVDATSGETYYFNEETGETAWDPPTITGPGEVVASPSAAQPPQPATSDLPDGWRLVVDDGSGEEYYVNDIDNTTCWERPTGSDPEGVVVEKEFHESETNSNDTSALNDGWVTVHDEQSGDHTSATIVANS
jgi:hypothetical protein